MAATFHLEIITPTKILDKGQVEYLRAPSTDGLFGVLHGHTKSMITHMKNGGEAAGRAKRG